MSLEERLEKIRSRPVPSNEESAKFQLIAPILENLGWDQTDGSEFLLEYAVGGNKGGRVDIALRATTRGHNRLVALIEAKAPGADLRQHVAQVLGYAFHEGVDICVLTTGLEWWLFLPREPGEPIQRRFATLDMKHDSVERLAEDLRAFLGREALVKGRAQKKAKSVLIATLDDARLKTEIPKIWDRMLNEPDEELVELIVSRVYGKLDLRPEKDQVIAALRGIPVPTGTILTESPSSEPTTEKAQKPGRKPSLKPVAIRLWGTRHPVSSHKAILHTVVELLYEKHASEFDKTLKLRGRKYPHVALDPGALGPEGPSKTYFQVKSSEYFIGDHGGADAMRKRADTFLECFGYPQSDLEVLFE